MTCSDDLAQKFSKALLFALLSGRRGPLALRSEGLWLWVQRADQSDFAPESATDMDFFQLKLLLAGARQVEHIQEKQRLPNSSASSFDGKCCTSNTSSRTLCLVTTPTSTSECCWADFCIPSIFERVEVKACACTTLRAWH